MNIDLQRCRRGMRQINVEGIPRPALIEEAIALIQREPTNALQERYLGIKNYAGFGDQREDHNYGYGPKHGDIVFRIERTLQTRGRRTSGELYLLDGDAIYYLEAYRDFGSVQWQHDEAGCYSGRPIQIDLGRAIRTYDRHVQLSNQLAQAFENAKVEAHV